MFLQIQFISRLVFETQRRKLFAVKMDHTDKEPPDKVFWMEYEETFGIGEEWNNSRLLADEMMRTIPGLKEEYKLDQITLGDGQCFMTAVIQQIRRPDVNGRLSTRWQTLSRHLDPSIE